MLSSEEEADKPEVEPRVPVMEVSTYLTRIGFEADPDTSLDCLSRLQAAHQHAVPYENLDVFLARKKLLEVGELYQKMVLDERGGWCCELNGLFCWLLKAIGFTVRQVSASYFMEDKQKFKEEFDHLALVVTISDLVKLWTPLFKSNIRVCPGVPSGRGLGSSQSASGSNQAPHQKQRSPIGHLNIKNHDPQSAV